MNEVKDTGVLLKRTTDEAKISVKMLSISKPMLKATSWLTGMLIELLKYHYPTVGTW